MTKGKKMKNRTYTTRDEVIEYEIIKAIDADYANANEYNIYAIADAVIGDYEDGFARKVNEDEFWEIVEDNAK